MHELAVTQNILEIALRHADNAGAKRIIKLNIVIGQLASFIDDSIQFYWGIIAKDTIAEKANLCFERIPVEFLCQDCNNQYQMNGFEFLCSNCGGKNLKIIKGKEFYLDSIDIE